MSDFSNHLALFAAVLLTVGSHVLLKIGSTSTKGYLNMTTMTAVMMFSLVTVLIVYSLQAIMLKTVIAMSALTFVLVPIASWIFLREELTKQGILASIIIVLGIIIYLSGG
ncbi:MAG: EamA family transporter [Candidatus Thiodiazotropha sp.]